MVNAVPPQRVQARIKQHNLQLRRRRGIAVEHRGEVFAHGLEERNHKEPELQPSWTKSARGNTKSSLAARIKPRPFKTSPKAPMSAILRSPALSNPIGDGAQVHAETTPSPARSPETSSRRATAERVRCSGNARRTRATRPRSAYRYSPGEQQRAMPPRPRLLTRSPSTTLLPRRDGAP